MTGDHWVVASSPCAQELNYHSSKESYAFTTPCRIVHGSNLIEGAGTSLNNTHGLWRSACQRQTPEDNDLPQGHIAYRWLQREQHKQNQSDDNATIQKLYREGVQHLRALMFLINEVVLCDKPFSEDLILEAHKILTYKVDSASDSYKVYGGAYRTTDVCAGLTTFTALSMFRARCAPLSQSFCPRHSQQMKLATSTLTYLQRSTVTSLSIFIPSLTAMVACVGLFSTSCSSNTQVCFACWENEQAKDEYLSIAARASQSDQAWKEADEEEAVFTKPPWGELALLILRQPKKDMQEVFDRETFCRNPPKCTCVRNVQTGHEVSQSSSSRLDG